MKVENPQYQSELVRSLASTIHKKMVAPSVDRMNNFDREISEINQKVTVLENKLIQLASAHRKTRFMVITTVAGVTFLGLALICLVFFKM